jgi:hypothetical protein
MEMYMQICQHDDWQKKSATEICHSKDSTTTRTPFGNFWNTQSEALECRCQEETMWLCTLRIWSVIWAVTARSLWLIVGSFFYPIYWGLSWFITIHDGTSLTHYKGTTFAAHMIIHLRSRRAAHNVRTTPRFWGLQNSERSQLLWQQLDLGQHIFAGSTWFIGSCLNHVESRFFMLQASFLMVKSTFSMVKWAKSSCSMFFSMGFSSLSSFSNR